MIQKDAKVQRNDVNGVITLKKVSLENACLSITSYHVIKAQRPKLPLDNWDKVGVKFTMDVFSLAFLRQTSQATTPIQS